MALMVNNYDGNDIPDSKVTTTMTTIMNDHDVESNGNSNDNVEQCQ